MEKRSRRRTRDLVTQAASQGLSQNEIGCARISMMARSTNAPCKGRIQMRKTNPLHLLKFGLQRTAGPYSWVNCLDELPLFQPSSKTGLTPEIAKGIEDYLAGRSDKDMRANALKRLGQNIHSIFSRDKS
jgi:hypothetical protein